MVSACSDSMADNLKVHMTVYTITFVSHIHYTLSTLYVGVLNKERAIEECYLAK